MKNKPTHPTKTADCPTCQAHTTFHYVGEQTYPPHVAQKAGFATHHFSLWTCDTCHTSLLEPNFAFQSVEK